MANTASTKSRGSNKARARNAPAIEMKNTGVAPVATYEKDLPERVWLVGVVVILLIAAVLRLYHLNLVPLHHDEGVNGNFLVRLVREGQYQYDPENYHGPTLYYFAALFPWIVRLLFGNAAGETYGLTTVTIRLVPVLFGLATIVLVFLLRRRLGTVATVTAALLLAISPGAVYLSRYFIHETQFVFFTLAIVVAGLYYYETRNATYLILASASASLLFATKETAMISAGVLIIAFATARFYIRLYRGKSAPSRVRGRTRPREGLISRLVTDFGGPMIVGVSLGFAVVVFAALYLLFYSSFFTNAKGISDSLQTFAVWTKTGTLAHVHSPLTYVNWLIARESPLLFLGVFGAAFTVLKPRNSFALFAALWAFGLIAAYSLIPYKTPWLLLNFIVPLALVAGYALQTIYELDRGQLRLTGLILFVAIVIATYQCIDLNFFNYDNDDSRYVYVYAHTRRGALELVDEIDRIAKKESGGLTGITVVSPDYWPLPWYLRNYSRVGYYGRMAPSTEPLIVANENQREEVEENFGELYRQVQSKQQGGSFELRPGVKLLLYERRRGFSSSGGQPAMRP